MFSGCTPTLAFHKMQTAIRVNSNWKCIYHLELFTAIQFDYDKMHQQRVHTEGLCHQCCFFRRTTSQNNIMYTYTSILLKPKANRRQYCIISSQKDIMYMYTSIILKRKAKRRQLEWEMPIPSRIIYPGLTLPHSPDINANTEKFLSSI